MRSFLDVNNDNDKNKSDSLLLDADPKEVIDTKTHICADIYVHEYTKTSTCNYSSLSQLREAWDRGRECKEREVQVNCFEFKVVEVNTDGWCSWVHVCMCVQNESKCYAEANYKDGS